MQLPLRLLRLRRDSGDDSPRQEDDEDEEEEEIGKAFPLWSPVVWRGSLMVDPVFPRTGKQSEGRETLMSASRSG